MADMEELGRNMVRKCGGLPLAIVVLGGVLATKHKLYEWKEVQGDISQYLSKGNTHDEDISGVPQVLALSYWDLPYHLKHCFLYLSHFPEKFEISTRKLIQMWVAEGFVPEMKEQTMEELGMHYLNELIDRGMVQVGNVMWSGRIKTCRLHDLMRDLCIKIAEQENFFKIIKDKAGDDQMQAAIFPIHRLVILSDDSFNAPQIVGHKNLRSLVLRDEVKDKQILSKVATSSLRVLDVENSSLLDCTTNFGKLNKLRFLYFPIEEGPVSSSIGNLRCLQTLDLRSKRDLQDHSIRIPDVIWMMEQLRHLYLPEWKYDFSNGKLRLANLRRLQTLVNLRAFPGVGKEVMRLTDLRKLKVLYYSRNGYEEIYQLFSSPNYDVRFNGLQFLSFQRMFLIQECIDWRIVDWISEIYKSCPRLSKMNVGVELKNLPSSQHFPENITEITLKYSGLIEDPMRILEKLPYLKILKLFLHSFKGKEMVCSQQGFPQLKSLVLGNLLNLEYWIVNGEAMPSLRHLEIYSCTRLKSVPDGLRFITTLERLEISCMLPEFVSSIIQGGKHFYKIQHVRSIQIRG